MPVRFSGSQRFFRNDDVAGLDFGAVVVHPHLVRLLAANGVAVLAERNWVRQHAVDFTGYMMLGLPSEFGSDLLPEDGNAIVSPAMITVRRLTEIPAGRATEFSRLAAARDSLRGSPAGCGPAPYRRRAGAPLARAPADCRERLSCLRTNRRHGFITDLAFALGGLGPHRRDNG